MNKVMLIGNLTKDVESGVTNSDIPYARFTLAVNRPYTSADGERQVDFLNVIAWRETAKASAKYLTKGKKACVVGSIQVRTYEAKDGSTRYATDIVASEVEFLTPKEERTTERKQTSRETPYKIVPPDDDLPF